MLSACLSSLHWSSTMDYHTMAANFLKEVVASPQYTPTSSKGPTVINWDSLGFDPDDVKLFQSALKESELYKTAMSEAERREEAITAKRRDLLARGMDKNQAFPISGNI